MRLTQHQVDEAKKLARREHKTLIQILQDLKEQIPTVNVETSMSNSPPPKKRRRLVGGNPEVLRNAVESKPQRLLLDVVVLYSTGITLFDSTHGVVVTTTMSRLSGLITRVDCYEGSPPYMDVRPMQPYSPNHRWQSHPGMLSEFAFDKMRLKMADCGVSEELIKKVLRYMRKSLMPLLQEYAPKK